MSHYVLNITHNNHTKTVHLSSNQQTIKVAAQAGGRYQILNDKGVLVLEPKMQEMGADLWIFLDGANDQVPDIIIEGYGNFTPITNNLNLMEMETTFALSKTPSATHLTPMNSASVPESTALTASEVSSAPAAQSAASAAPVNTSAAAADGSWKRVLGGALILGLLGGGGAAAVNALKDDDDDQPANPPAPDIKHVAITTDNVVNAQEAQSDALLVSGLVTGARLGDMVRLLVDGKEVAMGMVLANGTFGVNVSGSLLANAQTKSITVAVTATTPEGGRTTAQVEALYEVQLNTPDLGIEVLPFTSDNIINATEAAGEIAVSGSVENAREGDAVKIILDGKTVAETTVKNNTFSANVSGSVLANASEKSVKVNVVSRDEYGNVAEANAAHNYDVKTTPDVTPNIRLNKITDDNAINATEAAGEIAVSGIVQNAREGDAVKIILDGKTVAETTVKNNTFSANVSGSLLANASEKSVKVNVVSRDEYGNVAEANAAHNYDVKTTPDVTPNIRVNKITDDNAINATEAAGQVAVSGIVENAREGDAVKIILDGKTVAETTVKNNTFSVNISGSVLAGANNSVLTVEVNSRDNYGNPTQGSRQHTYSVTRLPDPEITLNSITANEDNIINAAEAAAEIVVSGSLKNVNDGDVVEIKLNNQVIATATAQQNAFSVGVSGKVLAEASAPTVLTASVTVRDASGNVKTAQTELPYEVKTQAQTPEVIIDMFATDDKINLNESREDVRISGSLKNGGKLGDKVEFVLDGEVVATATVLNGGTFWQYVSGDKLAQATSRTVLVRVMGNDEVGNPFVAEGSRDYDVKLDLAKPQITFDSIATDNKINGEEAQQNLTVSGKVTHAQNGDTVEIWLDGNKLTDVVLASGVFSVDVSGSLLAPTAGTHVLTAKVRTQDDFGNSETGENSHNYEFVPSAPTPEITLNRITANQDNVINANEAAGDIAISGTSNLPDGSKVVLLLDNQQVGEAEVSGGRFVTVLSGSVLVGAKSPVLTAYVRFTDAANNTAENTATQTYEIKTDLPQARIELAPISANKDDMINGTEAKAPIVVSGEVFGARDGDTVEIVLDNKVVARTEVAQGVFEVAVDGATLVTAEKQTVTARVLASDVYGNSQSAEVGRDYQVELAANQPTISLNRLTDDEVINLAESTQDVRVSGKVQNVQPSDTIELLLDGQVIARTQADATGEFSVDVSGSLLANATETVLHARVSITSAAGNVASAQTQQKYTVDTTPPTAQIELNAVSDGVLNLAESAGEVLLSGKVEGARVGDVITLILDGVELGKTTVLDGNVFEHTVSGSLLAQAQGTRVLTASVLASDEVGNTATATSSQNFEVDTLAPNNTTAELKPLTGDNILNKTNDILGDITVSGSTEAERAGNVVRFTVGGQTFSTTVESDGTFSVAIAGQLLSENNAIDYAIDAVDAAGNTATVPFSHDYEVVGLPAPIVSNLKVGGDNRLNENEAVSERVALSGMVQGARDGDEVRVILDGTTIATTEVQKSEFSVANLRGETLANAQVTDIRVEVWATDTAGNRVMGHGSTHYELSTLNPPTVFDLQVAEDGVLSAPEAANQVVLTGKVNGAREGDVVSITLEGKIIATEKVLNNGFRFTLDGKTLADANQKTLNVAVLATDDTGNQKSGSADITYEVVRLNTPVVNSIVVSDDNRLIQAELADTAKSVVISGSLKDAPDGSVVKILLDNQEIISTTAQNQAFSVNVNGADLSQANEKKITVEVTARDDYGNVETGKGEQVYEIITLAQPEVRIEAIAGADFVLSAAEAAAAVAVSGEVSQAADGSVVRVLLAGEQIGEGVVNGSAFSVNVASEKLIQAANKKITVQVQSQDAFGNQQTGQSEHDYALDSLPEPRITLHAISDDNNLNMKEIAADVKVSGTVMGARDNDVVRVLLDGKQIQETTVQNGVFSVNVSGSLLNDASVKTLVVAVLATDVLGNQTAGQSDLPYRVIALGQPEITNLLVSGDNKLNEAEASRDNTVSGKVTGARENDKVFILLDNQELTSTTVGADGVFSVAVSGAALRDAVNPSVTVRVLATDEVGNETPAESSQTYVVKTLTQPEITELSISDDNRLNMNDIAATAEVAVAGKVNHANNDDVVRVLLDGAVIQESTVQNGAFSVKVSGSLLNGATTKSVRVEVVTRDDAGNEKTAEKSQTYEISTLTPPEIELNPIANDAVLDGTEAAGDVAISGSVAARDNDVVRVFVGEQKVNEGVVQGGTFSVNVAGSLLKDANDKTVRVEVLVSDDVGNSVLATQSGRYELAALPAPVVEITHIAGDEKILNKAESEQQVGISGTVLGAREGDAFRVLLEGVEIFAGRVSDGRFEALVDGSVLAKDGVATSGSLKVEVSASDALGQTKVGASEDTVYQIRTVMTPPTLTIDDISGGYLNIEELSQYTTLITGEVKNASENSTIVLKVDDRVLASDVKVVNGKFSAAVNTDDLRGAVNKEVIAELTVHSDAGVVNLTERKTYNVVEEINRPTVEIDTIAQDNGINGEESRMAEIEITGRVITTPIRPEISSTETVSLTIGDYKVDNIAVENERFTHKVSGAVLAAAREVKASATTTDVAGNRATSDVVSRPYEVDTVAEEPRISLSNITRNNILDGMEAQAERITISGTATNTQDGDKVQLRIGQEVFNTEIKGNGFVWVTTGAVLSKATEVHVTVEASDKWGNKVTKEYTHPYQLALNEGLPAISVKLPIAGDNILNKVESEQNVRITGEVENVPQFGSSLITAIVNGVEKHARVDSNKAFSIEVAGSDMLADGNKSIKLIVTHEDTDGNTSTASVQVGYDVDVDSVPPVIEFNNITRDNTINLEESRETNTLVSGSLQNVREGDTFTLTVGGNKYSGKVSNNGFNVNVPTSVLLANREVSITVVGSDAAGNLSEASKTHRYDVNTNPPVASLFIDSITDDGVINLAESQRDTLNVSGNTTGASEGDKVELKWADVSVTGSVLANGTFSIPVKASDLTKATQLTAILNATNQVGNATTVTKTHEYRVQTELAKPVIRIDAITGDDIVNLKESGEEITITGYATNTRAGDTAVLRLGTALSVPSTIAGNDGKFTFKVSGAELAKFTQFTVTVNNSDAAGNRENGQYTHTYRVMTDVKASTVYLDDIAEDGTINGEEILKTLKLTGGTTNVDKGVVTLTVGQYTYTTNVEAEGKFTFNNVSAAILAGAVENGTNSGRVEVFLRGSSEGDNETTASNSHTYQVIREVARPEITLGMVGDDNVINGREAAAGQMVTITGTVAKANDGDKVSIFVGYSNTPYVGEVRGNAYAVPVSGAELAQNENYFVSVATADNVGNTAVSETKMGSYTLNLDTRQPEITVDARSFTRSQLNDKVSFSGNVYYDTHDVPEGNVRVVLSINNKNYTATVSGDKWFVNDISGSDLGSAWGSNALRVTATVTDVVGNQAVGVKDDAYQATLAEVVFNPITRDNVISNADAQIPQTTVTGKVIGDYKMGDKVSVELESVTHTASVNAAGEFTLDLPTADLLVNGSHAKVYSPRDLVHFFTTSGSSGTHRVDGAYRYHVKTVTNIGIELDAVTGDNQISRADVPNRDSMINITGRVTSRADPNDLKMVYEVEAIVNGNPYYAHTDGVTGAFSMQIAASDLLKEPYNEDYRVHVLKVSMVTPQDKYGNKLNSSSIFGQVGYNIDNDVPRLFKPYRIETLVENSDNTTDEVSEVSGSLNDAAANEVYRENSVRSAESPESEEWQAFVLKVEPTVKQPILPLPETADSSDEAAYVYPLTPSGQPAYQAAHASGLQASTAQPETALYDTDADSDEGEWEVVASHDLSETALSEQAHAIAERDDWDSEALSAAQPHLLGAEAGDATQAVRGNVAAVPDWLPKDEWETTVYQII